MKCKCGCGQEIIVKPHHKYTGMPEYIHGHNQRGKHLPEEAKKRISETRKGKTSPLKGVPRSDEIKRKIREAKIGHPVSEETKRKISEANKGKKLSEEARKNISEGHKGLKCSEETKKKIGDKNRGRAISDETKRYWSKIRKGRTLSIAHRKRISEGNKGKTRSEKTRRKMSEAKKRDNPMERPEVRAKSSASHKGKIPWMKGKHHTKEAKRKICEAVKHRRIPRHKTKPERIFEQVSKKNNLPYKYTGDGSFWIGKNPAINPDFVECNGKKIAIEIFSYWHDPLKRHCKVRYSATYEGRKNILKKYGWKLVVFWQEDLEREDAEQFVLSVLRKEGYTY